MSSNVSTCKRRRDARSLNVLRFVRHERTAGTFLQVGDTSAAASKAFHGVLQRLLSYYLSMRKQVTDYDAGDQRTEQRT